MRILGWEFLLPQVFPIEKTTCIRMNLINLKLRSETAEDALKYEVCV